MDLQKADAFVPEPPPPPHSFSSFNSHPALGGGNLLVQSLVSCTLDTYNKQTETMLYKLQKIEDPGYFIIWPSREAQDVATSKWYDLALLLTLYSARKS
jgi:hypothetical protein